MTGRGKENFPGGNLKYLYIYLKIRIFKYNYRIFFLFKYEILIRNNFER